MAGTSIATFAPQLAVWKVLNGGFFNSGYGHDLGALFHWSSPHLFAVLFSAQRGLFIWHPVFLLGLLGLILVFKQRRSLALLALLGFAIQWYLVSSWHNWVQGDAFGGRMFIVCSPIFVIGLAPLVERLARRWPWRVILAGGLVLVLLNLLLVVQYRLELFPLDRPLTFTDLTIGRLIWLMP